MPDPFMPDGARRGGEAPEPTDGDAGEVHQAGAIAVRGAGRSLEVLLVRSRRNPAYWIFPKGHVEPGESPASAAVRELREEAGVEGRVLAPAGTLRFEVGGRLLRVDYFVVEALAEGPSEEEERETRWCTPDEAEARLSFEDARDLLRRFLRDAS